MIQHRASMREHARAGPGAGDSRRGHVIGENARFSVRQICL